MECSIESSDLVHVVVVVILLSSQFLSVVALVPVTLIVVELFFYAVL